MSSAISRSRVWAGHPASSSRIPARFEAGEGGSRTACRSPRYNHTNGSRPERWSSGYFNRMPLAGLPLREPFHVARLDLFGLACTDALFATDRIACLSHPGINQLQQRIVYHQTRLALPTGQFHQAFEHTYEEADLLEEWNTELSDVEDEPVASFEGWIREGNPTRQRRLEDSQERAPIRREMREAIRKRQNERQCRGR